MIIININTARMLIEIFKHIKEKFVYRKVSFVALVIASKITGCNSLYFNKSGKTIHLHSDTI